MKLQGAALPKGFVPLQEESGKNLLSHSQVETQQEGVMARTLKSQVHLALRPPPSRTETDRVVFSATQSTGFTPASHAHPETKAVLSEKL